MSQTIDSRVVEMKFDNKNFEKNVAESMKTLENLDKRLTKLEQSDVHLDKVGKAANSIDLSKLDKSLDAITHRFSIMGQVGASVISNITTDAYNMAKAFGSKAWNTVFGQMKTGGQGRAHNIENAKFLLEGMGVEYEKVEKSIDNAVTDTAFGFDEAAMAAAQLSGASVQLGEDMDQALLAISGVAAMTNRSYSDIADIFVDSAAAGKVAGDAFNRLGERGLAAKGIMQEFYGVTAEELDKMARKGMISFNDFSKAMYDAFGTQAKKSNSTLEGVLANTRAALSRMGQTFYQPLMANDSDVVKMFQSLKNQLKALKEFTDPVAKAMSDYVLKLSRWGKGVLDGIDVKKFEPVFQNLVKIFNNLTAAAENLYTNVLKPFGTQFKAALYEVFPGLDTGKSLLVTITDKLVEASEKFRQFTADIGLFGDKGIALREVLIGILNVLKLVSNVLKIVGTVIKSVISGIGNAGGVISAALSGLMRFVAIAANAGYQIVIGIGSGFSYGISALMGVIVNIGHMIVDAFCNFFQIHSPSRLMAAVVGLPIILGIVAGILKGFPEVNAAIQKVLGGILTFVGDTLGTLLTGVSDVVVKGFSFVFDTLAKVVNAFVDAVNKLNTSKLNEILNFVKNIAIIAAELLILYKAVSAVSAFAGAANEFGKAAKNFSKAIKYWVAGFTIDKIGDMFAKFANIFKNFAILIGVFAGSIVVFSSMIKNGFGPEIALSLSMMLGIALAIEMLVKEMSEIDGDKLKGTAVAMLGLGAAILAFASGIKKLGNMEWYEIATAVVAMGVTIALLMKLAKGMSDSEAWYSQVNYKLILGFAAGVWLIAKSIKRLGKMPVEDLVKAGIAVSVLVGVFGGISVALVHASKLKSGDLSDNAFLSLAAAFVAFGICIKMISKTVIALGFIKPEKLEQGLLVVSTLMALITAVMLATHFIGGEITKLILSTTAMIAVMAGAIKILGDMKNGIAQGLSTLTVIMVEIGGFIAVLNKINPDLKSMASLAFVSAMLMAMTGTIKIIGEMNPAALKQGAIALSGLIAGLTGIIYLWSKFTGLINGQNTFQVAIVNPKEKKKQEESKKDFKEKVKYIKTIVNAVVELSLAIVAVGKLIKTPQEAITGIVFMITAFSAILVAVNSIGKIGGDKEKSLKGMASAIRAIALVMIVVGADLILLSNMPINGMAAAAGSIALILGIISAIVEKSKVFGVQGMDPKPIIASAIAIIAIGAALTAIAYVAEDPGMWGVVIAAAAGISLCLLALGKALRMIGDIKMDWKSGLGVLLAASSLIAVGGAIAIIAQFEWESYLPGLVTATLVVIALTKLLEAIGKGDWKKNLIGVGILIASCIPLVAVAGIIDLISSYDWQSYGPGLLFMSGALGILGLVALAIGKFAGLSALAGTASLLLLSLSLIPIAMTVQEIAGFEWQEIGAKLGMMVAALSVLALVAGVLGVATGGIFALAGAGAILMLAFAVKVLADAFEKFAVTVQTYITPKTAQQILDFFNTIISGIPPLILNLIVSLQTAVETIKSRVPELEASINEMVDTISDALTRLAERIETKGIEVVNAFGDMADGIKETINTRFPTASAMTEIGSWIPISVADGMNKTAFGAKGPISLIGKIGGLIESTFRDKVDVHSLSPLFMGIGSWIPASVGFGITQSGGLATDAAKNLGSGIVDGLKDGAKDLLSGAVSGSFKDALANIFSDIDIEALKGGDASGLLNGFLQNGISLDSLGGDSLTSLIDRLKEAGIAGDGLSDILKKLGIDLSTLGDLGIDLGTDEAKKGVEETKEALESLADEIINGKFGNAPERWDKMFEHLVKSGKTAEEAYAAIADAQNEVNKRLGSSVVHTADEMSKKVSESVKKANKATSDANAKGKSEPGKPGKDFKTEPFKSDSTTSKSDASKAADEQMKNNMPYANYIAAKHQQITGEMEKQTVEAYKQKLANEHIYTLKEKEQALASIKANQELVANSTLTSEKQKQLDAENKKYQKVVDTYNEQQKMVKAIQDQEAATKKAEEAEKKRGDVVKSNNKAVVYGSDEYYKQTSKSGGTINTVAARPKVETKPVETETKVEVTPKFEVKNADVSGIKKEVVSKVETELKDLQAKATITPKIDTSQAEAAIANFKQKTQDLKGTIPQTFAGISAEVSKHLSTVASKISQEGSKISNATKTVFQNAVSAAVTILNGNETITKFVNAGKSAGAGYAKGIRAKIADVRSAGAALGNTAIKATKAVTKTNSPSKVFTELGEWNGIGYGNGMIDSMKYVANASRQMGNTAMDEVYRIVNTVEDAVSNGLDITPTVTPVIDTMEIQNGISSINTVTDLTRGDLMSITANMTAKASYDNSQVEEMQTRLDAMRTAFNDLATVVSNQPTPVVEANVHLQGDAGGVFKLVRNQDGIYTKMHGKSAFAGS